MKQIEIFEGNKLNLSPTNNNVTALKCAFHGIAINGAPLYVPLDENILSKHILFLGGIGTGKTNAFFQITKQLRKTMSKDDVMIIFDTKGDFYKSLYQTGDIVISNDNTATGFWNIFGEIELNKHMKANIVEISKTLFHDKLENNNQPFFPNAAKDLFSAILLHFLRVGQTCDNKSLKSFLDSATSKDIRDLLIEHADLASMVSYIFDDRSPQTQGVISELQQISREIFIENFAEQGNLSLRHLVRAKGGKIVFVEYDLGIGNMLAPIYSLLFDMAIKEALSRHKSEGNVYFIVDEFSLISNLQHIDDAVNFGRSLGVKFMIGIQNINQVYVNYGEQRAKSLLSGFSTSVAFRVVDEQSRDFIRGIHGNNRKTETYMSAVASRGISEQIRDGHVVEDWDISRLKTGQAIIGLPGQEPFLFQFKKV